MSKWGLLVLLSLGDGEPLRWSELRRRAEGVSEKMLAQTLRTLVADGFVLRDARPVVPPHVEYSLTPRGLELAALLKPLMVWVVENAPEILESIAASLPEPSLRRCVQPSARPGPRRGGTAGDRRGRRC